MAEDVQEVIHRTLPSFHSKVALILGLTHLVGGTLIVMFGCVALGIKAFTSVGGSSMLAGFPLLICGAFAILSSLKKEVWTVTGYLLLAICCLAFCVTLLGAAATGISHESSRPSKHSVDARVAINIVLLVLSIPAAGTVVGSMIVCGLALFYGCCKQRTGARYVTNPSSSDSTPPTTTDAAGPEVKDRAESQISVNQDQPAVL